MTAVENAVEARDTQVRSNAKNLHPSFKTCVTTRVNHMCRHENETGSKEKLDSNSPSGPGANENQKLGKSISIGQCVKM